MTEPGWYPDPSGAPGQRYFDGSQWTDQRSTGATPPKTSKKRWILFGGLLAVVVFFVGCGAMLAAGGSEENEDSERSAATTLPSPTDQAVVPAGSAARDGMFEFQILRVGQTKTLQDSDDEPNLTATAEGLYVVVTVTVTNVGDEARSFSGQNQILVDTDGREFGVDSTAEAYANSGYDYTSPLNPGDSIEVDLPFDVPPDGRSEMMKLRDSASSPGVKLELPWY